MDFSNMVKKFLNEFEMNPSDLARKIGYSPQYIHELLKGEKRWNEETMGKVCEVLGLELSFKQKH